MAKREKPFNNPFLGIKLPARPQQTSAAAPRKEKPVPAAADDEAALFRQAVGEVSPVRSARGLAPPKAPPSAAELQIISAEVEALTALCELVAGDGPIDVADSDEYIEGGVRGLDPRLLKRLKAGEFASQAHLDLHGMTRAEAKVALERFISDGRRKGLRSVLVITGRGLHSKDQVSVLKEGVQAWLTRGRMAAQVLAFSSARPSDGGLGAVYVLLRR